MQGGQGRRVLHVSQPVVAGVPRVVLDLVADGIARGDDVHVACPPGAGLARRATALGATHHAWSATRDIGRSVLRESWDLRAILRRVRPDVVVLHSAKAGLAGRLTRVPAPVVYVPHAWSFLAATGLTRELARRWEVLAGRRTDVVVCVSEDELDRGRAVGVGAPMVSIPNGVDLDAHRPADRGESRGLLGLDADAPTVVCVGRLAEQKGVDRLLDLWPNVRQRVPAARLVVVGDGPEGPALRAREVPGVEFAGTRDDVDVFLAAADVVAVPSRWEGSSLVGLEAMAAA